MLRLYLAAVLIGLAGPASSAEWVCVSQQATGFVWNNERWERANFRTDGETFVVSEVSEPYDFAGTLVGIEVTKTGTEYPAHHCRGFDLGDQIACGGLGYGFMFNRVTLRFQETYGLGYVDGQDGPGNTPNITIGTCSKLPGR